jgi:hypothetical protein
MTQPQLNCCALLFFLILAISRFLARESFGVLKILGEGFFQCEPVPESSPVPQLIRVLFRLSCLGLRKRRIRTHFPRLRTGLVQNIATGREIFLVLDCQLGGEHLT